MLMRVKWLKAFLVATTAIMPLVAIGEGYAVAQTAQNRVPYHIPAQSLASSLSAFARASNYKIAYATSLTLGKMAPAIEGNYTAEDVLERLLSGSGLSYRFTGEKSVSIAAIGQQDAAFQAEGTTLLDTITVTGGQGIAAADAPYSTAAPTAYISEQTIDRFRGSSPADIFRGTAGVMSAEARNGAGSIDVNIRGMQGMGRVKTTIDGAENAINIYQGYQGISNRTFVDPDLLAGVEIQKGSDAASSGIAGTVAMRTVEAGDIVKEGNRFGIRVKGGFGTNSSKPVGDTDIR
jgi:hemoglobin/transferrin/lactoferrin receptor protein